MADEKEMYFSSLLEEYKTLREESKQAGINMLSAFRWGGAAIGAAFGAGFLAWYHKLHLSVLVIFFLLIPILAALSMFLWLGEAIRFKRVGDYLCLIEQKVALFLSDFIAQSHFAASWKKQQSETEETFNLPHTFPLLDPLNWEQWLRATRAQSSIFKLEGHQALAYLLRLISFPVFMITSFFIGIYYVVANPSFTPNLLKFAQDYVVAEKQKGGSTFLIILALVIITFSGIIGGFIALKLQTKTRVITKEAPPDEESTEGNAV